MPCKKRASNNTVKSPKKQKLESTPVGDETVNVINRFYGMEMPNDFYPFWNMCLELNSKSPLDAFSVIDLLVVGPFYYLKNNEIVDKSLSPVDYHMKWRFYYDTPEFLTLMVSKSDLYHIGYFRDDPNWNKTVVADNSGKDATVSLLGDNMFAAVRFLLMKAMKTARGSELNYLKTLTKKVQEYAKKEHFSLEALTSLIVARKKKLVTNCFHKAGIVVPIVNGIGYRPLPHDDSKLKHLFKKVVTSKTDDERLAAFEPIQEMITFIQFANDECDYGMGLELGIDLFCDGSKYFFKTSEMLLTMAYQLLNMDLYAQISKAHFADRRLENFSRI